MTMWSHYADNHKGFCIKYRLSHRFIKQEQYSSLNFCCIKPIKYVKQINNIKDMSSINNELAFFTKASCWNSECEVRLLDYDKGYLGDFKQLELDKESQIEEICFGCRCTAQTIKNIIQISSLLSYGTRIKFYQMKENDTGNIYKLQKVPVLPHKYLHNIK